MTYWQKDLSFKKYKESAQVACLTNPNSQPSLDTSPNLIPDY
jgi:hypothetical protein